MKQINSKLFVAFIITSGLFVGFVKGQDAKNRWVSKMKARQENKKSGPDKSKDEVPLDDFEIASFHKS